MSEEVTIKNIHQRINSVQKRIGYIQKTVAVSAGGGSYKATSHDAVVAQVREHMIEEGIGISVSLVSGVLEPKEEGSKQSRYRAEFSVSFVNIDSPDDNIVVVVPAFAMDSQDKHCGKAMSMAKKYAILQTFLLETGEDEESRYQTGDYDFDAVLKMAGEAEDKATASALIKEARAAAVKTKNGEALKEISSLAKAPTNKFGGAAWWNRVQFCGCWRGSE